MEKNLNEIFGLNVRKDFAFFETRKEYTYLDSSMTTLKPRLLSEIMTDLYTDNIVSYARSENTLLEITNQRYLKAYDKIAKIINSDPEEIIPTPGTTDGLNKLARSIIADLHDGDEIILGELDHASAILPWMKEIKLTKKDITIRWYQLKNLVIDLDHLASIINPQTKLIVLAGVYNTTSALNPVKEVKALMGERLVVVDGAQLIGHYAIDVKDWNIDFLVFGAHKIFGPTGIGILYGKKALLDKMAPFTYGGGMNSDFTHDEIFTRDDYPDKFLGGTPNVADFIAMAEILEWFYTTYDIHDVSTYLISLKKYAEEELNKLGNITIFNPTINASNIIFKVNNVSAQDVNSHLNKNNVIVRPGSSCVKINNNVFEGLNMLRASFHVYNTKEDIDKLISVLKSGGDFIDKIFG